MKPWLADASSLADSIRSGDIRAADALEASLDAIAASKVNAIAYLDADGARRQAEDIDRRIKVGEDPGLFAGVPLLVKDLEHAKGMPTTHGSVPYKDNIVDYDSIDVGRLRSAGAIIVGKSTASEFGFVAYCATKLFGITRNPWNLERTSGASSAGSAAAVAGGLVPTATASDGGGSIRIPAAYCGLVGMKGTFGRIPRGPGAHNGPLTSNWGTVARSVRDAARWYDITSGYDPRDAFSLPRIDGWERDLGTRDLRDLRVAVAPDLGGAALVHPDVERITRDAADALIDATGMRRVDVDVVLPEKGSAWASAGAPSLYNELKDYWPACKDDLTFEIRFAMEFMDRYRIWHAASADPFRVAMNEAMAGLFEQVDVVLCATNPIEPFNAEGPMPNRVGETKVNPFNNGALTIPCNISGYPAISIPAGLSPNGLPIGLQAITRRHEDALLLDLALAMERSHPWPLVAPGAPV